MILEVGANFSSVPFFPGIIVFLHVRIPANFSNVPLFTGIIIFLISRYPRFFQMSRFFKVSYIFSNFLVPANNHPRFKKATPRPFQEPSCIDFKRSWRQQDPYNPLKNEISKPPESSLQAQWKPVRAPPSLEPRGECFSDSTWLFGDFASGIELS